ncbi:glycosyltransferase family 4 protein [Stutzerimonas tarimensis]|uniref:Glycosyltransferase family 4 protein n=1 Tax=Stutzerimonas tarimensis TaxID=1507735 RepID=A0ABV7T4E6_9GAMM
MKVAHIVRQYLPSIGGMEEMVRSLAASQRQGGIISPSIITLDRVYRELDNKLPEREMIEGTPVTRISYRGSERYPIAPAVLAAIKNADLVHVHGIDFFYDFLAATRWLHRKPLVASTHGGFFHTAFASRLKQVYFKTVTRASSFAYEQVIATSAHDGSLFEAIVPSSRLCVIENGVDTQKFAHAASPSTRPVMLYFGRWSSNKGLLEALQVFAALQGRQPETGWKLIIAGRPYDLDQAALAAQANALGVAEHIEVFENPSQDQLRTFIGRASYYICLSHHEGFGIAAVEALSAGLSPILSDIPPFRRLAESTGRGLLIDRDRPEAAAQQILAFVAREAASGDARQRNADSVSSYAWQGVESQYLEAYRRATGAPKLHPATR